MTDKTTKKPRGRPKLPDGVGKRVPLNMRTTQAVRDKVEEAARKSGRSLVQEVEFRLEKSFQEEEAIAERLGDRLTQTLFFMMGAATELVNERLDCTWHQDERGYKAVLKIWNGLIAQIAPSDVEMAAELVQAIDVLRESDAKAIKEKTNENVERTKRRLTSRMRTIVTLTETWRDFARETQKEYYERVGEPMTRERLNELMEMFPDEKPS